MRPRDPHEPVRAATPLELLYDLCFVVAIAQAAAELHHAIAHGHGVHGMVSFAVVFMAIWWAWMGFCWFASAFDPDDAPYRLKVLVQMVGVLVLAAGVKDMFAGTDFTLVTIGYSIMRVALVAQWLRAFRQAVELRRTAGRYAAGIAALQLGWIAALWLPPERWILAWMALIALELLVPVWAERAKPTPWHPHHVAERYGLLTIIVLGESVLAATIAIQSAAELGTRWTDLLLVICAAPVIMFSLWWIYFSRPHHVLLRSFGAAFLWGYGHYFIFAAAAAAGAGIAVAVDHSAHEAHIAAFWVGQSIAVPVALFLSSYWLVVLRACRRRHGAAFAVAILGSLLAPLVPGAPALVAAILAVLAGVVHRGRRHEPDVATA